MRVDTANTPMPHHALAVASRSPLQLHSAWVVRGYVPRSQAASLQPAVGRLTFVHTRIDLGCHRCSHLQEVYEQRGGRHAPPTASTSTFNYKTTSPLAGKALRPSFPPPHPLPQGQTRCSGSSRSVMQHSPTGHDLGRRYHSVLEATLAPAPPVMAAAGHAAAAAAGSAAGEEGDAASVRGVLASSIINLGETPRRGGQRRGGGRQDKAEPTRRQQRVTQATWLREGTGEGSGANTSRQRGPRAETGGSRRRHDSSVPHIGSGQTEGEDEHDFIVWPVDAHNCTVEEEGVEGEQDDLEHPVGHHKTRQWVFSIGRTQ